MPHSQRKIQDSPSRKGMRSMSRRRGNMTSQVFDERERVVIKTLMIFLLKCILSTYLEPMLPETWRVYAFLYENEVETETKRKPRFLMAVSVSKMKKPFLTKRSVPDNGSGKNVLRFFLERGLLRTVSSADRNLCQVDLLGGKSRWSKCWIKWRWSVREGSLLSAAHRLSEVCSTLKFGYCLISFFLSQVSFRLLVA